MLTGNISNTLRNQTAAEISAFDILSSYNMGIIGDMEGNLLLRKLDNGILVKNLYKHKSNVIYILSQTVKS